ncbi:hypothetical protein ACFL1H_00755 [Nanoarchaeota archaeon]
MGKRKSRSNKSTKSNKTDSDFQNKYIVMIVAIVAIAGLIYMFTSPQAAPSDTITLLDDELLTDEIPTGELEEEEQLDLIGQATGTTASKKLCGVAIDGIVDWLEEAESDIINGVSVKVNHIFEVISGTQPNYEGCEITVGGNNFLANKYEKYTISVNEVNHEVQVLGLGETAPDFSCVILIDGITRKIDKGSTSNGVSVIDAISIEDATQTADVCEIYLGGIITWITEGTPKVFTIDSQDIEIEVTDVVREKPNYDRFKTENDYGSLMMGAANKWNMHFITTMPKFYFNKAIMVRGHIAPYSNDIKYNWNLGTPNANNRWNTLYVKNIDMTGEFKTSNEEGIYITKAELLELLSKSFGVITQTESCAAACRNHGASCLMGYALMRNVADYTVGDTTYRSNSITSALGCFHNADILAASEGNALSCVCVK